MKPTKELFDIIKSMTGSEKRYFKLSASMQKGNKNYIKLFDAIDSQKTFDENEIKSKFRNESFIRNLTVTKNYLSKLIFKSLIYYQNERSTDAKLNNILSRCKLLNEKGLYKQFFKAIKAGKELAYKTEKFSYLLEFIDIEKYIMKKEEIGKKDMNAVYDEEVNILEIIKNINFYKRAVSNLFRLSRTTGSIRDNATEIQINNILHTDKSENEINSVRARESYYLAKILKNKLKGNYQEAIEYCKKRYDLISNHPLIFNESIVEPKLDSLEFYISSALKLKNFSQAKRIFKKYKVISAKLSMDKINQAISDFEIKLVSAIEANDTKASDKLIPDIEKFLTANEGKVLINSENYFRYNIARYYFMTGDYDKALKSINNFAGSRYLKSTPEFESYLKLLNILIHYELGNYKLLKYLIPSAKKFLSGKKKLFKFESMVLNGINNLIKLSNANSIKERFRIFYEDALKLRKDRFEKNAFEYFDLLKWIEIKLR